MSGFCFELLLNNTSALVCNFVSYLREKGKRTGELVEERKEREEVKKKENDSTETEEMLTRSCFAMPLLPCTKY